MQASLIRLIRRRWWIAASFLVAVSIGFLGWSLAQNRTSFVASDVPRLGPTAMPIVPGVYMLGGLTPSAAYVVETSAGLVLIDSGLDAGADRLKAQMAKLHLDWRRIHAILITHVHGDHCGGAQILRAETGAKVYAGRDDAAIIRAGEPREAFFSTFYMPNDHPHPTTVDVELDGDEILDFGNVKFFALAAAGHTPGSVCYLMEGKDLRALFAGDVIMKLSNDPNPTSELAKPLGTYSAYLAPRYRGDAREMLATLKHLHTLDAPNLILPGHPSADTTPQSPVFTPQRWESLIDGGIADMELLIRRYTQDGPTFLDGIAKPLVSGLDYLGEFKGTSVYSITADGRLFLVGAPGGPGLVSFIKTRWEALGRRFLTPTAIFLTSCGAEDTGGLAELIGAWHPKVVATQAGIASIKTQCPPDTVFVNSEDLASQGWLTGNSLTLAGRGFAPVAYQFNLGGKTLLFSGRIPIKVAHETGASLFADFTKSPDDVSQYIESLTKLRNYKPDLWMPAVVTDGQNAHLYDRQWDQTLIDNVLFIKMNVELLHRGQP